VSVNQDKLDLIAERTRLAATVAALDRMIADADFLLTGARPAEVGPSDHRAMESALAQFRRMRRRASQRAAAIEFTVGARR
jgi:hypothetical protein